MWPEVQVQLCQQNESELTVLSVHSDCRMCHLHGVVVPRPLQPGLSCPLLLLILTASSTPPAIIANASMSPWGVMYIVVGRYGSPLRTVSAMHHADHLGILGADDWTGGPAGEQEAADKPASQEVCNIKSHIPELSTACNIRPLDGSSEVDGLLAFCVTPVSQRTTCPAHRLPSQYLLESGECSLVKKSASHWHHHSSGSPLMQRGLSATPLLLISDSLLHTTVGELGNSKNSQ